MLYSIDTTGLPENVARELRKIAEVLADLNLTAFPVTYVAPEKPRDRQNAICDGTSWNPIGDGVKRPVWYDATAAAWKKFT